MNHLLDSPLEALAFNDVSFGVFTIVNNLWTWVALITAAVSFWKIRTAGAAATSSCSVKSHDQNPSTTSIFDPVQAESRPILEAEEKLCPSALVSAPAASATETSVTPFFCNDKVSKGGKFKLTVYYEDDGESDDIDGEMTVMEYWSNGDGDYKEVRCGAGEWWESWERLLSMRKGETGWYRYQDLTAINGNVVRLWG
ncbi:hypothetical protein REPUB_Repub03eG0054500 [Reevesia pubescens]